MVMLKVLATGANEGDFSGQTFSQQEYAWAPGKGDWILISVGAGQADLRWVQVRFVGVAADSVNVVIDPVG